MKYAVMTKLDLIAIINSDELVPNIIIDDNEYYYNALSKRFENIINDKDIIYNISFTELNHDINYYYDILDDSDYIYLSRLIAPFRNDIDYIQKSSDFLEIYRKNSRITIDLKNTTLKFNKLKTWKRYSVSELGLDY